MEINNLLESAFVAHPKVAEAAVVGYPHDIKGNGLYCCNSKCWREIRFRS